MIYFRISLCVALLAFLVACENKKKVNTEIQVKLSEYPDTKKVNQEDHYFGTTVEDPYRWLENDRSEETEAWVKAQNELTFNYLSQIPSGNKIRSRLTALWNYPKHGIPEKKGNYYLFFKNDGLQNQNVLCRQTALDAQPEVLLDPNQWSEDGTVNLARYSVSQNGKYLAYAVARSGSDWNEIYVMDMETRELLKDTIKWVKFSNIAWYEDGFFYGRYKAAAEDNKFSSRNEFHQIYYHQIGEAQKSDQLIYEDKEHPNYGFFATMSEDEQYLQLSVAEGTSGNKLIFKNITKPDSEFIVVIDDFSHDHIPIDVIDGKAFVLTNLNASNNRLVAIDLRNPAPDQWKDIIPHQDKLLQSVSLTGNKLLATYLEDASNKVYQVDFQGNIEREIVLPGLGTVAGFKGSKDATETFYSFTSFTNPTSIYKYTIETGASTLFRGSEIDFDFDKYETKQVFYKSKDGTKVPMFIVHKKGLVMDGNNPTYLYGYGGFDINLDPDFKISRLVWLENGGIYAQPNLRGGGEYGQVWHKGGMLLNKQNVFDDFIAAAEYLVDEGYTSPDKLAIAGRSNGGLLVGACMTQRPDLFKVALPGVGVLDMLRYHKFTIGHFWAVEYGSSEDSTHFENLYAYSPLHNIKAGTAYPATLVHTADHDDRVVPAHSFKFIATLQEKHRGAQPVLIRIDTKAGHGAGKPTAKIIDEWTDIFTFTFYNLGVMPYHTN